jgi:nucleoside phosphorylase
MFPKEESESKTAASAGIQVDFGIITIREDEFKAALDFFKPTSTHSAAREYNLAEVETISAGRYRVAIVRCVEPGTGEAQEITRDMLDDVHPAWIIVLGIAGGVPTTEFTLGDVVVSTRVQDFSVEAVLAGGEREFSLGGGPVDRRAGAIVANLAAIGQRLGMWNSEANIGLPRPAVRYEDSSRYIADEPWNARVRESLQVGFASARQPVVTTGEIASSDRLVKDFELLQVMQRAARKLVAIEMEAAGVYRAAREKVPAIAIRGISDIVGLSATS